MAMRDVDKNVTKPGISRRKAYQAPRVAVVNLAAEEVMASGCKITSQNAIGTSTCLMGSCSTPHGS